MAHETKSTEIPLCEQIVNSLGSAVLALDGTGRVLTVNPAALVHLDVPPANLCAGMHLDELRLPEPFIDALREIMKTRRAVTRGEIALEQPGGELREIGYSAFLLDGPKTFNGAVFLFTDMTERRVMEREAEQNRQLAYVGELAAGVVHELRNPLSIISGLAQLMVRSVESDSRIHKDANKIIDETLCLNKLVTRFLCFARPFDLELQEGDVQAVMDRVILLCQAQASERNIDLVVDQSPDLPHFVVDADRAAEALSNIVVNAVESTPAGGRVLLGVTCQGESMVFLVQDEGAGIHLRPHEDPFVPFFTTKVSGTGLGLPIAHRLISAHGGKVNFGNGPKGGAFFEIRLPLEPPSRLLAE